MVQSALNAGKQLFAADRLFDEVEGASLHGLNRYWHVAVAGHHDGRQSIVYVGQPLVILLKDCFQFLGRYAVASITNLDGEAAFVSPATEQDLATPGVFQGIRKQVPDHLLQQSRIAAYRKAAENHTQSKTLCLRVGGELILHAREQIVDRELNDFGANGAGLDLVYVEITRAA